MRTALAAGAIALLVYLRTLAPGLTEIDSGELATCAATLGIAHPSGYPLFSALGRVWTLLSPGVRAVTWMNALSALLAAAAAGMVARIVLDLLPRKPGPARHIAAAVAALAFAFHPTLWDVAVVTEVHALQMFLDAALVHAVVRARLWGGGPLREKAFLASGYLFGMCLSNHLTSAMLFPGIALGAWRRRRALRAPLIGGWAAACLLACSAYAFLPVRSAQEPFLDWGSPETWEAFRRHVGGAQYRVWMFAGTETLSENLARLGKGFWGFTLPGLGLLAVGLAGARRIPGLLPGSAVMALVSAGYALGYSIHDIDAYFLPAFLISAVWIGIGAERVAARWRRVAPALALAPAIPLVTGWKEADRSGDGWVESFARAALAAPPPDSIVLNAYWDVLHSPALYLQVVEGVRPDVILLDQEHFRRGWNVPWLRAHRPELLRGREADAERLHQLVLRFERGQPYQTAEIQSAFDRLLSGILEGAASRGGAYVTLEVEPQIGAPRARFPDGLLFRLVNPLERQPEPGPAHWPDLPPSGEGGRHAEQARAYAARMARIGAAAAERRGELERARAQLDRVLLWTPDDVAARAHRAALEAR